jgi:hypothetical protein
MTIRYLEMKEKYLEVCCGLQLFVFVSLFPLLIAFSCLLKIVFQLFHLYSLLGGAQSGASGGGAGQGARTLLLGTRRRQRARTMKRRNDAM